MPRSPEAERGILGCIILDNQNMADVRSTGITAADFTEAIYARIFTAAVKLAQQDKPIDPVTLKDEVPGEAVWRVLVHLDDGIPKMGAHAVAYAREVVSKARRRDLIAACQNGIGDAEIAEMAARAAADSGHLAPLKELDFDNPPEPVSWVVEGLLETGGLTFMAGSQESGKTYAALDLAITMIVGGVWLRRFRTHLHVQDDGTGGIVYLDEENGAGRMRRRISRLAHTRGGASSANLHGLAVLPKEGITDADTARWQHFVAHCVRRKPALIIIDTLRGVFTGKEDDSGEAEAFLRLLKNLQREAGDPAFLILAHPGKNRSRGIRGSSRWPQAADSILNVVSVPGSQRKVKSCYWDKLRDGADDPSPFAFRIEDSDGKRGITINPVAMKSGDRARELHKQNPDWTQEQLADELDMSQSAVSRALREMGAGSEDA